MTPVYRIVPLLLLGAMGCDRPAPSVRRYQEISIAPERPVAAANAAVAPATGPAGAPGPGSDMASTPVQTAQVSLQWTLPAGWVEGPARAMRLATFLVGDSGRECVVTVFPGDVGGLEANLRRWLGQMQAEVADADLARFARAPETFQTEGGLPCLVYDFAGLLPAGQAESLLAAVVPLEGSTAFVKFGGPRDLLATQKSAFLDLCRSLRK